MYIYIQAQVTMGKFNWWRRHKPKRKLKREDALTGVSFLLQQIRNGDYDVSDYRRQAREEFDYMATELKKVIREWKGGSDSLKEKLNEVERKYIKRHNRLMKDYHEEENKRLHDLKEALEKEFGVDVFDKAVEQYGTETLEKFYFGYKKLATHDEKNLELELEQTTQVSL